MSASERSRTGGRGRGQCSRGTACSARRSHGRSSCSPATASQEAGCAAGSTSTSLSGNANSAIGVITVVMLLVALGGLFAAHATARALRAGEIPDPRGRVAFMARFGTIASLLFSLAIVLSGIPIFALESCHT